jgi:archaellum component FlaC
MNFDTEEGDDFEEFISYLEEQSDIMTTAQDTFDDIEESVKEIKQRGRDSVSSIYNQVKEGLIKNYET